MAVALRVLISQKAWYDVDGKIAINENEVQTRKQAIRDSEGNVIEEITHECHGGVIEDNMEKVLGYTYDKNRHDSYGNRRQEHIDANPEVYAKFDWSTL